MWLFTETGFVSAVINTKNPGIVAVRARDKQSLAPVAASFGLDILRSPEGDYPYRVFVQREQFAQWAFDAVMNLGYRNFKARVFETRGYEYAHELGRVWSVMLETEDVDSREGQTGDAINPADINDGAL